jgi:hypothetical protein
MEATRVLVSTEGKRVTVEVSAVALKSGEQVVGVFGLVGGFRALGVNSRLEAVAAARRSNLSGSS